MITLTLESIEFGKAPSGSIAAIPAKRHAGCERSTAWKMATGQNRLVYPFVPFLAGNRTLMLEVTFLVTATAAGRVWIKTTLGKKSSSVLGTVAPTPVDVAAGISRVTVPAMLESVALGHAGIERRLVHWKWFRGDNDHEITVPMRETTHDVFVILETPQAPWNASPGAPGDAVWTDLLEFSCRCAGRARTAADAAAMITERVFHLGGIVLEYGKGAFCGLARDRFLCGDFLAALNSPETIVFAANCTEISTMVVTLANSLGCNVHRLRLATKDVLFKLNQFQLIGLTPEQSTIKLPSGGFKIHEVVATLDEKRPTAVYDACVGIDFDDEPGQSPSNFRVSAGLPPAGSETAYIERLVRDDDRADVAFLEIGTLPIETTPVVLIPEPDPVREARYAQLLDLLARDRRPCGGGSRVEPVDGYRWSDGPIRVRTVRSRYAGEVTEELWRAAPLSDPGVTILALVFDCRSAGEARKVAAEDLAWTDFDMEPHCVENTVTFLANRDGNVSGYAFGPRAITITTLFSNDYDVRPLTRALILAMMSANAT